MRPFWRLCHKITALCGVEPTPEESKAKQNSLAALFVNGSGNPAAEQAVMAARSKALTDWAAGKSDKAEADTLRLRKAGDEVFCFLRKHIAEDVWSVIESDGDYTAAFESHKGRPNGYLLLQIITTSCRASSRAGGTSRTHTTHVSSTRTWAGPTTTSAP